MAKYNTIAELFTAIAAAIRGKAGTTDTIPAQNFPEQVAALADLGPVATLEYSTDDESQLYRTIVSFTNKITDYDYIAAVVHDPTKDVTDIVIVDTTNFAIKGTTGGVSSSTFFLFGNTVGTITSTKSVGCARNIYKYGVSNTTKLYIDSSAYIQSSTFTPKGNTNMVKKLYGIKGDLLNLGG